MAHLCIDKIKKLGLMIILSSGNNSTGALLHALKDPGSLQFT